MKAPAIRPQPSEPGPAAAQRASTLIVCPRCGFGNSLRVMATAMVVAEKQGLALAHLWRQDSPVGSPIRFEDEITGARSVGFETLFVPIPEFPAFVNRGQRIRLLYEEDNGYFEAGLNLVEAVSNPCTEFQHHGPLTEAHLAGVDATLVLTSLNFPATPAEKVRIYQRHFRPQAKFQRLLETHKDILQGRWLCVHLRTNVRTAYAIPEWDIEDIARKASQLVRDVGFDRLIVFSDVPELRADFAARRFGRTPVEVLDWPNQDVASTMFLDFLAMSQAALILSSGVSSFSYEAALFGGGIPFFDMCRGLLMPRKAPSARNPEH